MSLQDDDERLGPIGGSALMREVLAAVDDVAPANTTVLLLGESGTGKEVFARHIHRLSERAQGAWVAVNCAALPGELLESELFGHERGAFTGATERRIGRIEQADRGTLLLDEISEMPLPLQAKLLRVLQEREVDRVGGGRSIPVDVRVIATSNRDLEQMVAQKLFRADLYYRLSVFPIALPPLRERREDISLLAAHLVGQIAERLGRPAPTLSASACACLAAHDYPGNVRELGNILERALVRCRATELSAEHLDRSLRPGAGATSVTLPKAEATEPPALLPPGLPIDLGQLERLAIAEALRRVEGNRTHAARLLGISLRTLRNKLRAQREEAAGRAGQPLPSDDTRVGGGELARRSRRGRVREPSQGSRDGDEAWVEVLARPSQEESAA
jgi:transcriptional regulator with GAF, ATPase, and Fis domain